MTAPEQSPAQRLVGDIAPKLVEAITHLAFYAGWPRAMSAVGVARAVFTPSEATE
jgi:4-carboxymuconolactone decarboxylase